MLLPPTAPSYKRPYRGVGRLLDSRHGACISARSISEEPFSSYHIPPFPLHTFAFSLKYIIIRNKTNPSPLRPQNQPFPGPTFGLRTTTVRVALKLRSLRLNPLVCVASRYFNTNQRSLRTISEPVRAGQPLKHDGGRVLLSLSTERVIGHSSL